MTNNQAIECLEPFVQDTNHFDIELRDGCYYRNNQILTNFCMSQVTALCAPDDPNSLEAIQLQAHMSGNVSYPVIVDIRKGSLIPQITTQISVCRLFVKSASSILDAYLLDLAQQNRQCGNSAIYFREGGLHRLWNHKWVMVCGDELIGDCGDIRVCLPPSAMTLHLAWNPQMKMDEAIERQLLAMKKYTKSVQVAFGFTLLSALRSAIMKMGFSTFPVLFVQGMQNFGKTVLVTQQCLLFDHKGREKVAAKLEPISTEIGLITEIGAYRDQVVVVDDMAKSSHTTVERDRLRKMAGLIRYAANDSERRIAIASKGTVVQECTAGVALTGEVSFTAASDLSRIILVVLNQPLRDGDVNARSIAATAYRAWLQWFLSHANEQFQLLEHACKQAASVEQARLQTTQILLLWVLTSFYQFALERKIIKESYFRSAIQYTDYALKTILEEQKKRIEKSTQSVPKGNLSWYILHGYHDNAFHIVTRKNIKSNQDCIIEDGALCIRMSVLKNFLTNDTPYKELSQKMIGSRLVQEGAIQSIDMHKEKRSATKKIKGHRYLEIPFDLLSNTAQTFS